ncbi:hypothetical protein CEP52_014576 [Fusarium oligoseptatum]|uniref:Uncharacterized protein n=1 Tax=Fusarium oligoseptatum TaxID=2604345 RepID=A0A428SKY9_9HYPO|nr:hypothetical protein CEP52_014576 [Fusarium oligoseptatum]
MNHANMIEDKHLKKTYIIAVLCSTLVGTFTSSIGLWDRVKERRKQNHRDTTQDEEIKKLKEQVEKEKETDEVSASLRKSSALISREFEDGYERLGRKFAIGDVVTENKLQAQVIALQQTVINVLQDAVYHGRRLDRVDMEHLIAASNAARDGSLGALREQRQRLLMATEKPKPALPPPSKPMPPQKALPAPARSRGSSIVRSEHPRSEPVRPEPDPLYCIYSIDLQCDKNMRMASTFAPGGICQCPACGLKLGVEADDIWAIRKPTTRWITIDGYEREVDEDLEFIVNQRFVIKCHTPDGDFACVLCTKFRDGDVLCASADALINHVGRSHSIDELEWEPDFRMRVL